MWEGSIFSPGKNVFINSLPFEPFLMCKSEYMYVGRKCNLNCSLCLRLATKKTSRCSTDLLLWGLVLSGSTLRKAKFMSEDQPWGQDGEFGLASSDP